MFEVKRLSSIEEIESGRSLSSPDFKLAVDERAVFLSKNWNVSEESTVLLLQHNSIEFFLNLLALFQLKATVIPFDPSASLLEIDNVKNHSSVNLIITEDKIESSEPDLSKETDLKNIALLLYTSGTTGTPKAVMISYQALNEKMKVLASAISSDEVKASLCGLPTFFGHGLICNSLFPLLYGEKFFIAKKFELRLCSELPGLINEKRITFFSTVPSVWQLILNFSEKKAMPELKRVHCASSPLSNETAASISEWLGSSVKFFNVYGITEMLGWFGCKKFKANDDINAFDEFWAVEKRNSSEGECLVRSSYMFSGYLKNSEANALALTNDGFFKTGDLFENYSMKGRLNLVVNKKGQKIYPEEISRFLSKHPSVKDVYCFGKKDDFSNELLGALIVLNPGAVIEEVKDYCRKNLTPAKNTDFYIEVHAIERNARGKVSMVTIEKLLKDK